MPSGSSLLRIAGVAVDCSPGSTGGDSLAEEIATEICPLANRESPGSAWSLAYIEGKSAI